MGSQAGNTNVEMEEAFEAENWKEGTPPAPIDSSLGLLLFREPSWVTQKTWDGSEPHVFIVTYGSALNHCKRIGVIVIPSVHG